MSQKFAVWHCTADGRPFGQPMPMSERPDPGLNSIRLHVEPVDPEYWEIMADRQHELHQAMMEEFSQ